MWGSVYQIAKALYMDHDFEPDVAVSAAHCYVTGEFPVHSYAQAMAYLERVKRFPELTGAEVEEIERAYFSVKIDSGEQTAEEYWEGQRHGD